MFGATPVILAIYIISIIGNVGFAAGYAYNHITENAENQQAEQVESEQAEE